MPDDVRLEYEEAALIASLSPKAGAALLRLAIEKLCLRLGKKGKMDKMIGELVSDGLSVKVQRDLDIVRVIGNESVHPGTIDLRDDPATVQTLFRLVNLIVESMISEPKQIAALFGALPPSKLEAIESRNRKALRAKPEDS